MKYHLVLIPEVEQMGLAQFLVKVWSARWLVVFSIVMMVVGLIDYFEPFMPKGLYPVLFVGCNMSILLMRIVKQKDLEKYNV